MPRHTLHAAASASHCRRAMKLLKRHRFSLADYFLSLSIDWLIFADITPSPPLPLYDSGRHYSISFRTPCRHTGQPLLLFSPPYAAGCFRFRRLPQRIRLRFRRCFHFSFSSLLL
jgi:hypothetical protein